MSIINTLEATPAQAALSAAHRMQGAAVRNLRFRTARQIAEDTPEEVAWIARPWIATGSLTEIIGKAKVAGKTTWLMAMIRQILDGMPFMDEPTSSTPVVFLTEERGGTIKEALRRAGLLERDDLFVLQWQDTRAVAWDDVVNTAVAKCLGVGARLLVVDTLPQFAGLLGDKENNAGDVLSAIQPLQFAAANNIAVVVVRHERKGDGAPGETGRGSSAFTGAADIVLTIRKSDKSHGTVREIHGLSRFDETPSYLAIDLTEAGYVALGNEKAFALAEARRALLKIVPELADEARSLDDLRKATALKRTTVQEALSNPQFTRIGKGVKGDPLLYYLSTGNSSAAITSPSAAEGIEATDSGPVAP
jgi:hypothetical protein